ncbi:MAG TPA: glycogen-binding domain-containing protein [Gemmatimonadaceae bacterium]|nr:glycogen-binding domain-containing protein [Gemmatimonadaceae bacterium]
MKFRWAIVVAMLLAPPASANAQQTTSSFNVGTARMRYADSIDASALSASVSLRHRTSKLVFDGSGTTSRLENAWSNAGSMALRLGNPLTPWSTLELASTAGGSVHSDGARTGQVLGALRLNVGGSAGGAWVGGGVGRAWDGIWRQTRQGDAGAWATVGSSTAMAFVAPTVVGDTIRYTDVTAWLGRAAQAWEADASLGMRMGNPIPSLPSKRKVWGGVSATRWVSQTVGVQAAVGAYPVDFTQGFPGGRYLSLSLRLAPRRIAPLEVSLAGRPMPVSAEVRSFRITRVSGNTYDLMVQAPRASRVELMGDFTQWTPRLLTRDSSGTFRLTVVMAQGTHQVNLRVDGGAWTVPPGLIPFADEFAGSVGLLDVP